MGTRGWVPSLDGNQGVESRQSASDATDGQLPAEYRQAHDGDSRPSVGGDRTDERRGQDPTLNDVLSHVSQASATVLQEIRDRQSHNWKTSAKILGCICVIQAGALIAQGIDQSERNIRMREMGRLDLWMTQMFGMVKAYDKRLDDQDRINSAVKDWILEVSKRNGTKYSDHRGNK